MWTDVNVAMGHWPFRHHPFVKADTLQTHLEQEGIGTAWVSHLGAAFHPDPDVYNQVLFKACAAHPGLYPVPVLNPALPGWQRLLEQYASRIDLKAVKLWPSYHNYRLYSSPVFELLTHAEITGLRILLQIRLEDERQQYFALKLKGVPINAIIRLARRHPEVDLLCLSAYLPEIRQLAEATPHVRVDTSFAEWLYTLPALREVLPVNQIFFGSHTPLLYTRPGLLKLTQSTLPDHEIRQIGYENAKSFFGN